VAIPGYGSQNAIREFPLLSIAFLRSKIDGGPDGDCTHVPAFPDFFQTRFGRKVLG